MGYEIARFVSKIDDEVLCSICSMVLEDPMESSCGHVFCNDCISRWLEIAENGKARCPVDTCWLALDDIKPVSSMYMMTLDRLKVKCNYEPKGCQTIVALERLQQHLTECAFQLNEEVNCDKGCNIKITKLNDKVTSEATAIQRQQEEITKLVSIAEQQLEEIKNLKKVSDNGIALRNIIFQSFCHPKIDMGASQKLNVEPFFYSEPAHHGFKIKLLNIYAGSKIKIVLGHAEQYVLRPVDKVWKNGDIIECGIKLLDNFTDNGETKVEINCVINDILAFTHVMLMPSSGISPVVYISDIRDLWGGLALCFLVLEFIFLIFVIYGGDWLSAFWCLYPFSIFFSSQ